MNRIELSVGLGSGLSPIWDNSGIAERRASSERLEGKKKTSTSNCDYSITTPSSAEWVEVDTANVRVENELDFGGPWLALN